MEEKYYHNNIFESGFDSFEFDDKFLIKIDEDSKGNKSSKKEFSGIKKLNSKLVEKKIEKDDRKTQGYDLSLFIEDFDESDFFESGNTKNKKLFCKVSSPKVNEKPSRDVHQNGITAAPSPTFKILPSNKINISSSTPLKPKDNSSSSEKLASSQKPSEISSKNSESDYLEADLFEDWDIDKISKPGTQKETVTLSQALKLIEEAKLAENSDQNEASNHSIDLLTGEVVGGDVQNLFAESFDLPKSVGKNPVNKIENSSDESVVVLENNSVKSKPQAAQKLNFESKEVSCSVLENAKNLENNLENFYFGSDDDFDVFIKDLTVKEKKNFTYDTKSKTNSFLKECDLNESNDDIKVTKKRGKCFKIIDSEEDSPLPKHRKQNNSKPNKRKVSKENSGKDFFDLEAEVSDEFEVSDDEDEEEDEYEKSFLDEESYCTQNCSADMTAKYLESVKELNRPGAFKIPKAKPYNPDIVFSQVPQENNTDYEIDSFCVNEVEEDIKTELSDLEIAEKILEMDRKERKRRIQRSRKIR